MLKHYPLSSVIYLLILENMVFFFFLILCYAEVAEAMPSSTVPCVLDLTAERGVLRISGKNLKKKKGESVCKRILD